jgi:hypothetical protein
VDWGAALVVGVAAGVGVDRFKGDGFASELNEMSDDAVDGVFVTAGTEGRTEGAGADGGLIVFATLGEVDAGFKFFELEGLAIVKKSTVIGTISVVTGSNRWTYRSKATTNTPFTSREPSSTMPQSAGGSACRLKFGIAT